MKNSVFSLFVLLALVSCDNKKSSTGTGTTKDSTAKKTAVADNPQKVIYQSATYYAGRVEFHFHDMTGADVMVNISNMPEDSGAVYPKYLLESCDALEGPPGENPAMVGKSFLLIKNAAGEVREIKPAD